MHERLVVQATAAKWTHVDGQPGRSQIGYLLTRHDAPHQAGQDRPNLNREVCRGRERPPGEVVAPHPVTNTRLSAGSSVALDYSRPRSSMDSRGHSPIKRTRLSMPKFADAVRL